MYWILKKRTSLPLHTWRMSYVVWLTATLEGSCLQHPRMRWWFRQSNTRRLCLFSCWGTCLESAPTFCHWLGYCSHLQVSLEDVPLSEVSVLRLTLILKMTSDSRVMWANSVPILVFLGLFVRDLGPLYAIDRETSDAHHRLMPPPLGGA